MAASMKHVCRIAASIPQATATFRNVISRGRFGALGLLKPPTAEPYINARSVCTEERLKIDVHKIWCQRKAASVYSSKEQILESMRSNVEDKDNTKPILSEDIDTLLAIVGVDDLDMLEKAIKKFHAQKKETGSVDIFRIGPNIMKTYYMLNQPDRAIAMLKDKELDDFFTEVSTYTIAFQMLYNAGRYQDVLNLFDYHMSHRDRSNISGHGYPYMWTLTVLTSCYLMNTAESYKFAMDLFVKMRDAGLGVRSRQRAVIAALAMKQGHYEVGYELCSPMAMKGTTLSERGVVSKSLPIVALAKLGRVDEALEMLNQMCRVNYASGPLYVCEDAVDAVTEALSKLDAGGSNSQRQLLTAIRHKMVSERRFSGRNIHTELTSPLAGPPRNTLGSGQFQQNQRFQQPMPQFQRRAGGGQFQQGFGQYREPGSQFQPSGGQFQQGYGQFQQPGGQYQQQGFGQFQQPGIGQFQQPGNQFQSNVGQYRRPPGNGQFQQAGGSQFQQPRMQFQQDGTGQFQQGGVGMQQFSSNRQYQAGGGGGQFQARSRYAQFGGRPIPQSEEE